MNELWKQYMQVLLGHDKIDKVSLLSKILKADFHGAIISIFNATNKNLIGIEGIVIKET